jgi:hypothetical protein
MLLNSIARQKSPMEALKVGGKRAFLLNGCNYPLVNELNELRAPVLYSFLLYSHYSTCILNSTLYPYVTTSVISKNALLDCLVCHVCLHNAHVSRAKH